MVPRIHTPSQTMNFGIMVRRILNLYARSSSFPYSRVLYVGQDGISYLAGTRFLLQRRAFGSPDFIACPSVTK